jgi:F0F1-type ATP synthase membrane subunit b/b'
LLEAARRTLAAIDESLREYEQKLRATRAEGYHILELQRTEALRAREAEISAMKEVLGKSIGAGKQEINDQVEEARKKLAIEARQIGLEISARILGRPADR